MDERSESRDSSGSILAEACRIGEGELEALVANPAHAPRRDELIAMLADLRRLSQIVASWRSHAAEPAEASPTTVAEIMTLLQRVESFSAQSQAG